VIKERYLDGLESLERGWREDILMAETLTTITPPSSIGLEQYLDRLFFFMSCTFSLEGSSTSSLCARYCWRNISGKIHFLDNFHRWPFSPLSTVESGYDLDMFFIQIRSRLLTVDIGNKHSEQKLCFLHSRSTSFK